MAARRRAPLGQNFLYDPNILGRIARAVGAAEWIFEIGAGPGTLTARLVELGKRVLAIEIDHRLAEALPAQLGHPAQLEVLEADILKVDLRQLVAARTSGRVAIAGNLPYYITSPILHRIFDAADRVSAAVVLVQREVAARIAAKPGTRDFGYLSVLCQAHSRAEVLFSIAPGAFRPAPKVISAAVRLTMEPRLQEWGVQDRDGFLEFAQLCFHQKRKTLLNNLQKRFGKQLREGRHAESPELRLRAEQLGADRLAALYLRLTESPAR